MIFVWLQDLDWYCDYCPPKGTSVVSDLHIRPGVGGHILLCVDVISAFRLCLHALTPWSYPGLKPQKSWSALHLHTLQSRTRLVPSRLQY